MSDSIFIKINKNKLKFQATIYTTLGLVSAVFLVGVADVQEWIPPIVLKVAGIAFLALFVLAAGAKVKKISDPNSGLLIDKQGIHDLTSDIGLGLIKWKDIVEVRKEESIRTDLLLIAVKKNETYLKRAKNKAIGSLLKQNIRMYDTPVAIDPSYLKGSLKGILNQIEDFRS